jgi:hypothetical protein
MLIPGSPWVGAARRGRSTRATFLCARTEEVGGSGGGAARQREREGARWEVRGRVGESPILL